MNIGDRVQLKGKVGPVMTVTRITEKWFTKDIEQVKVQWWRESTYWNNTDQRVTTSSLTDGCFDYNYFDPNALEVIHEVQS